MTPVTGHVAVLDPLPMYQQGVAATLAEAGHIVEVPADPLAWLRRMSCAVVLLTLSCQSDWELLTQLGESNASVAVIALLDEESPALGVRAVRAGARSVLLRRATAAALRRAVDAAMDGQAVLPAAVLAALGASSDIPGPGQLIPSTRQLEWLRQLAAGSTVTHLATRAGYSERAMFRLLQALYRQIGVRTRIEAVMMARDLGWLPKAPRSRAAADPPGGHSGPAG